ncbi:hypothetical protein [Candidatus Odyssella acanthamoebae]|uniref:Uncharacterized protein n=1 Tax=Candidatus Odyssella acanthamoebae TaxID=91604 RepID=A0A077B027_9PROT|nr:hypothetical protein [Candidatus Paracaedibacter acanthamoebae]AIK96305.1 hypothetical protein ID47_05485 [Candidatus Paracaedibacter acanthamoebae]
MSIFHYYLKKFNFPRSISFFCFLLFSDVSMGMQDETCIETHQKTLASESKFIGDFLYQYDENFYNNLDSPDKAYEKVKSSPHFEEFLGRAFSTIIEYDLPIGFRLLHKHNNVSKKECMVEVFHTLFPLTGEAAYVTRPHSLSKGNFESYPASWAVLENGDYRIFEFSNDYVVHDAIQNLISKKEIMRNISNMILENNLESLISIAILDRSTYHNFKTLSFLERSYKNFGNVLVSLDPDDVNLKSSIPTSWFPKKGENKCSSGCDYRTYCEVIDGSHTQIQDHYLYHNGRYVTI